MKGVRKLDLIQQVLGRSGFASAWEKKTL